MPHQDSFFRMHLFGNLVMVYSTRDIMVFNAKNGNLYLSINSLGKVNAAQVVQTENIRAVVYSDDSGTHMYAKGIHQKSTEDKFVSLSAVEQNTLFGLTEEKDSYTLYSIDPATLKATKVKSGIKTKKAGFTFIKPNKNYFGVINCNGYSVESIQTIYYDGKADTKNNFDNLSLNDIAITDVDIQAVLSRKNRIGNDTSFEIQNNGAKVFKNGDASAFIKDISFEENGAIDRIYLLSDGNIMI
jgi:hypothetical protein